MSPTTSLPSSCGASSSSSITSSGHDHSVPPSPSKLALASLVVTRASTSSSTTGACLSVFPTVLIRLIKTWLVDKEALHLSMTNHHLEQEVQGFYKLALRPAVAALPTSPIASCRNTVNLAPSYLSMGDEGESLFQQCLAKKTTGLSESLYRKEVLQLLRSQLSKTNDAEQCKDLALGAGLGLGGSFMSAENRDALLNGILSMHASCNEDQMGAMILGACQAFGQKVTEPGHQLTALEKLIASGATGTPEQLGAMTKSLCVFFGGPRMSARNRLIILNRILIAHETCTPVQLRHMIQYLCLALGGKDMTADHRDGLLEQLLAQHKDDRSLNTPATVKGLCMGLGGPEMTRNHLNAVLAWLLGAADTFNSGELIYVTAVACAELGQRNMSPEHRDIVLDSILASHKTSTTDQLGGFITGLCFALNGMGKPLSGITLDNVDVLVAQVLKSRVTNEQLGALIHGVISGLRGTDMPADQRAVLVTRIRESGRLQEIIDAIRLVQNGQVYLDFFQLETGGI